jgi:hypothetical protein
MFAMSDPTLSIYVMVCLTVWYYATDYMCRIVAEID